jgi:hypothetical protein
VDVAAQVLGVARRHLTVFTAGDDQRRTLNARLQAGIDGLAEVV